VPLAVAKPRGSGDYWYVISDAPTAVQTLEESGLRFDIAENVLDDKSHGLQLESSWMRSPNAMERLGFGLAITTLSVVSQGTSVVQRGQRRLGDPHWFRGASDLQSGWRWVRSALSRGYELTSSVYLSRARDPEPAMASRKQEHQRQCRFLFEYQDAA
jgi:hypothetical protein